MSKLIRGVFLTMVLCIGLSAAARRSRRHQRLNCASFPTAEAAADAVTEAIRNNDDKALTAILGATWHEFAPGGDRDDDEIRAAFLKAWDEKHAIIPEGPDKALFGAGTTGCGGTHPDRQAGQRMALRRRGRQEGDAGAPDRPQRAGRHADVAGDRRCPARLCRASIP